MAKEIERKFLVSGDFSKHVTSGGRIVQGYLTSVPERTVRVRIRDEKGYLTIKGPSGEDGIARVEFEYHIPVREAEELLKLCEPGVIDKIRYLVPHEQHVWEVDVFDGCNEGLVVAEIELKEENEPFVHPSWLGQEVTGQVRYYNAMLSKRPYNEWSAEEK
ncbi:CYTH domain-containing protein [Massilibacteroides sp.]|uniref:CYTH domain-containing protein n=1 Tax=Massilibacteroides sp. TaxID=2034766 RepID=UPI00262BED9C|nr:CYTH domain-containing protein [Massilibacteroides sp.]MDD4515538.1 CYTH domain-containing protein [Massilibacteroides sp.]